MIDSDLAKIYQVETKNLNRAVKRNIDRFPNEFMFQLTKEEYDNLRCQNGTSSLQISNYGGRRYLPFAFTEHGVVMLSSVLNSEIATKMNIAVVKAFVDMRRYVVKPAQQKLDDLERILMLHIDNTGHNFSEHTEKINKIINQLNKLISTPAKPSKRIGFAVD